MTNAKIGTFEELLEMTHPSQQPTIQRLREIILDIYADSCEVVRLGDRAATYGLGPKKMSEGYVYLLPYESWVNLGFYKGADLSDPEGLMEGTGAKMRHVKVRSLKDAEQPQIQALIRAAIDERKKALGR